MFQIKRMRSQTEATIPWLRKKGATRQRSVSETPLGSHPARNKDVIAGFGASDLLGHAMPFLKAGLDAEGGRDSSEPKLRHSYLQKQGSVAVSPAQR